MSCNIKRIKGCEVAGSTFNGRKLSLNRDISDDTFKAKVKTFNQKPIAEITGFKNATDVYFPFNGLENLSAGLYLIEYWGNFEDIGNELFCVEEFSVVAPSKAGEAQCCDNNNVFNFVTEDVSIDIQITATIVNIGGGADLSNYYKKSETYSKDEVDDIISDIPVVDTSNLVPYTGANKDVNIGDYFYKTSKGFDFIKNGTNYFKVFNYGNFNSLEFSSMDTSANNYGGIYMLVNPAGGFVFQKYKGNTSNQFNVNIDKTFSQKKFETNEGYQITGGTANQSLTADGGVFDLNTKADLVGGKVPKAQSQPSTIAMNSSTYVITFTDATGAVQTIDLPLESLFQNANYDAPTKSLIVTLQDGTTRTIPLTDLVDLPEIVLSTTNPAVTPTSGQKVYFNTTLAKVWFNVSGVWVFGGNLISDSEKANLSTAYNHSQATGNVHNTTKSDIGLGNVDNTSDLDKPVSTATQIALNSKQDKLQDAAGNIGVGKPDASATEKLDVNGNVKATGFKTLNGTANQGLKANGDVFDLNTKADLVDGKVPSSQLPSSSKTTFTHDILVSNWSLVSGKYEAVISNAGILSNSFVDIIPSNDHVDIVRNAQIYPSVLISEGSVKVYSKFLPSGTISVTININ